MIITLQQHLSLHPVTVDDQGHRCGCDPDAVRHSGPYPEDEEKFYQLHDAHVVETWNEARTIRTLEDLNNLPFGALIIDAEHRALENLLDVQEKTLWWATGDDVESDPVLPAHVLLLPDEKVPMQ